MYMFMLSKLTSDVLKHFDILSNELLHFQRKSVKHTLSHIACKRFVDFKYVCTGIAESYVAPPQSRKCGNPVQTHKRGRLYQLLRC